MILFATFDNKFICKDKSQTLNVISGIYGFSAKHNIDGGKVHVAQKPVELISKLIKDSTNKGDLVLDPFLGSGTTAIAALNLNRRFIGFELDERYFDIAQKRIDEALVKKKQELF